MAKIKINSSLQTSDDIIKKELMGIYQDDKIIYSEDDIKVTLLIEDNKIRLSRNAKDYQITIYFVVNEITKGNYDIKEHKIKMDLGVKTNILEIYDNKIVIEYELKLNNEDMGPFKFELQYEVIK